MGRWRRGWPVPDPRNVETARVQALLDEVNDLEECWDPMALASAVEDRLAQDAPQWEMGLPPGSGEGCALAFRNTDAEGLMVVIMADAVEPRD